MYMQKKSNNQGQLVQADVGQNFWLLLNPMHVEGPVYLNPLPHMPVLGSSNSAANKDINVKNIDSWGYNFLIE